MKKVIPLLAAVVLCIGVFAGCGAKNEPAGADKPTLKDGETVQTIVTRIVEEVGMQMPTPLDDGVLKDMFYVDHAADVEAYYGEMAMSMTSSDNVVAVHAKADKTDAVAEALNKRLEDVRASFERYLPDQYEKAKKGQVIVKGDYVFLVIIGLEESTLDEDMAKAVKIIDEAFA